MNPNEFTRQAEVQKASVSAFNTLAILAAPYATRASRTHDGFVQGPITPLRIDPGASLRRRVLSHRPASGFPLY